MKTGWTGRLSEKIAARGSGGQHVSMFGSNLKMAGFYMAWLCIQHNSVWRATSHDTCFILQLLERRMGTLCTIYVFSLVCLCLSLSNVDGKSNSKATGLWLMPQSVDRC